MNRPRWLSRPHKLVDALQIVVFGNQDEGQEARSGEAARNRAAHAVCRGKPGDGGGVPWQVLPKLQDRALCPRSRVRAQVSPRPQAICNPASASSSCSISRANICELAPNFWRLSLGDLQAQGLHQEIMRVASCPATEGPAPSGLRDHQAGRTR